MPITIYNRKTGQPVTMDEAQAQEAIAAGTHGLPKGQDVNVVNPEGLPGTIPADQLHGFLQYGGRLETQGETRHRQIVKEYGEGIGSELAASALGAARGLSFGLSDPALQALGVERETLAGLKEANPAASITGELAGVGGALLIPGLGAARGAGALGKVGQAVTAPVRGVASLGRAVEAGAGAAAKGMLGGVGEQFVGRALTKAVGMGAGSAVEGALYGAGQYISEASLGEIDATAENLLGHVGMGAAIGGAFGAGLGAGFESLGSLVKAGGRMTKQQAARVVKRWEGQTGNTAVDGLADAYAQSAGVVSGAGDDVGAFFGEGGAAARREATVTNKEISQAATDITAYRDELEELTSDAINRATGQGKAAYMRKAGLEADRATAEKAVFDHLGTFGSRETGSMSGLAGELDEMLGPDGVRMYGKAQGVIKTLDNDVRASNQRIVKIIGEKGDDAVGNLFHELDGLKRNIGRKTEGLGFTYQRTGDPQVLEAIRRLDDQYQGLRNLLEDQTIWGKTASAAQREVNAEWVPVMRRVGHKSKYNLDRIIGREDFHAVKPGKSTLRATDPGEVEKFINDLGTNKVKLDREWLTQQLQSKERLIDSMAKHYDIPADKIARAKELRKAIQSRLDEMEKKVGLRNQMKDIEEASRGSGMDVGTAAAIGYVLGGPVGAGIGAAAGALINPAKTIRQLATLDRVTSGYRSKISQAVGGFVDGAKKAGRRIGQAGASVERKRQIKSLIAPVSVTSISFGTKSPDKKDSRPAAYRKRLAELNAVVSNPDLAIERITRSTEAVAAVAPKVAEAVQSKTIQAARYLVDKAPKRPGLPGMLGDDKRWRPSDSQIDKWERYIRAAASPLSVVEDLQSGKLTREAVETIRTLYPRIYDQITREIVESMDEIEELPYRQRIALDVLFPEVQVDPTMRPDFMAAMQAATMQAQPGQMQQPQAGRLSGLSGAGRPEMMTQAQRIALKA